MIVKKTTLQETLYWSVFNLNQRERLGRPTPCEVLIEYSTQYREKKGREEQIPTSCRYKGS